MPFSPGNGARGVDLSPADAFSFRKLRERATECLQVRLGHDCNHGTRA